MLPPLASARMAAATATVVVLLTVACNAILGIEDAVGRTAGGDGGPSDASSPIVQLAAGTQAACALVADGRVWCWGANRYGGLGHPPEADPLCVFNGDGSFPAEKWPCSPQPRVVQGVTNAVQVSVGDGFTCAVLGDAEGSVVCWGLNDRGQLGHDAALVDDSDCGSSGPPCRTAPTKVSGLSPAAQVAAGSQFACAVTKSNDVYCWGDNGSLQLADTDAGPSPVPHRIGGVSPASEVTANLNPASEQRYACVRLRDGSVKCWGSNSLGVLGHDPGSDPSSCSGRLCNATPTRVAGLPNATGLQSGLDYVCVSTDEPDAASPLYCWGNNANGTFAAGAAVPFSVSPAAAAALPANGLRRLAQFATRWTHAVVLDEDGGVWTWGDNSFGALALERDAASCNGYGSPCDAIPTRVASLSPAARVVGGEEMTIVQLTNGEIWTWGANPDGRLGHSNSAVDGGDPDSGDAPCRWAGSPFPPYFCNSRPTKMVGWPP